MEKVKEFFKARLPLIFLVFVLAVCFIPALGLMVFGPSQPLANEQTSPEPLLSDGLGVNFALLPETADFVNDRFFLRRELITAGRRMSAAVFGSTGSDEVLVGRDGWLFYAETMDDYTGADGLTDRELFAAAENIYLMQEYCQSRDVSFLFTVAPNKNTVYPEMMKNTGAVCTEHDTAKLYALLENMEVEHLDLLPVLQNGTTGDEKLYFAHDSHWTGHGAAAAADAINRELGRESSYFFGVFAQEPHLGDLYEMLYPGASDPELDRVPDPALEIEYLSAATRPDSVTLDTKGPGEGSLLCFRDSFGNSLYSYLANSFATARFSRMPSYDLTLIDETQADTVVVELVERNLDYLLDYAPNVPAPEREIELPDAASGEIYVAADDAEPAGWAKVSGVLPVEPDGDSPVYVSNGVAVYEAVLTRDGFRILVPAAKGPWVAACSVGGVLTSYELK